MDEYTNITESLIIIVTKERMMQSCSVTHYSLLFVFLQIFQEGLFSQWQKSAASEVYSLAQGKLRGNII